MGTVTMLCLLAVVLIIVAAIVLRQRRAATARRAVAARRERALLRQLARELQQRKDAETMTTEIHTGNRKITYGSGSLSITKTSTGRVLRAPLTAQDRRALANALDPIRATYDDGGPVPGITADQGGQWTRDELSKQLAKVMSDFQDVEDERDAAERERDAAVERAEQAERERDACGDRLDRQAQSIATLQGDFLRVERERDAAVERAEAAEKRHTWPKTTPTGHTYFAPDTYSALCHQHGNAAQAAVESWDADECPPEPTWEMVGIAHREVERIQRDRDEWKARAEHAEQLIPAYAMLDIWMALGRDSIHFDDWYDEHGYADAWAELTAAVREAAETHDDPAVYVVRESEVAAVPLKHDQNGWDVGQAWYPPLSRGEVKDLLAKEKRAMVRTLAIARAIGVEAEQAADPIEAEVAMAWAEYRKDYQPTPDDLTAAHKAFTSGYLAARHVLGQEASDE